MLRRRKYRRHHLKIRHIYIYIYIYNFHILYEIYVHILTCYDYVLLKYEILFAATMPLVHL
jgi:hypothetical protein